MRYDLMPADSKGECLCGVEMSFTTQFGGWLMSQADFYPGPASNGVDVYGSMLSAHWVRNDNNADLTCDGVNGLIVDQTGGKFSSPALLVTGMPEVPAHIQYAIYLFNDFGSLYWVFDVPSINNGL